MTIADYPVLSFDCYGTLIDWERGVLRACPSLRRAVPDDRILRAFAEAEHAVEAEAPGLHYQGILLRVHARMSRLLGIEPDEAAAFQLSSSVGDWPPFDDTVEALAELSRHHRLVVLSNIDDESFAATQRRLGIELDAVYTAEAIGSYKPDPANFEYLIAREAEAGFATDQLLHVAQSIYHDHVPATQIGLTSAWIERPSILGPHGMTPDPPTDVSPAYRFWSLGDLVARRAAGD